MGLELAKMHVRIRGDYSALPEDFQAAKAVAEANMRDIVDSMAGIFHKAQGIKGFLEKGIAGATDYEQTVTEFETLIGSAEKTEETLKSLTAFAVKTPFEMPQLLGVTRGLLQFGERGQEMMGTLKMLGDVSQGNARKFGTLGMVFNQVRAEGKLTRENFLQMANQGLVSLQDVSKHLYGVTTKTTEASKAMSDGKISFDTFRKILEKTTEAGGKNHNAMERQATTLGGLNSTLSDAINITARLLAQPLMPYLKALVTVQIKVAEGFSSIVQAMGPAASGMAVGAAAVSSLGLALTSASLAARFFGISIRSAIIGTGVGAVLIAVGAALGAIVMWIADAVTKTEGWKDTLVSIAAAWDVVMEAASTVASSLLEVWEAVFGSSLTDSIGEAAEHIAGLLKSVADWVVSVKQDIINAGEAIAFFFRNVSNLVQLSLVESLIAVMEMFPQVEQIYQDMAVGFASLWSGASAFFKAWLSNISGGLIELKNLSIAVWEAIKAGFIAAFQGLSLKDFITGMSVEDVMKRSKSAVLAADKAFSRTLAKQDDAPAAKNPFDEWKTEAAKTRKELEAGFAEEGGAKGALESRRKELLAAIAADEKARSKAPEEKGKEEDKDKDKKPDATKPQPKVDAGRYGFEQFGNKFQDAILKAGAGNEQKQMVSLLEHSNKVQDEQLGELKKKKGGLSA